MSNTLALLGGTPIRNKPFPTWPIFGREEEDAVLRALRSGNWGRLSGNEVEVGSSRVDLQACKLEYSIVSPK